MGDRVAVLKDGLLQQVDSPRNMYDRPANLFVAGFIGSPAMNLVEVPITDGGVKFGNSVVPVSRDALTAAADKGDTTVTVGVRPEHFDVVEHGGAAAESLSKDTEDAPAGLAVTVNVVEELGADGYVYGTAKVGGEHQGPGRPRQRPRRPGEGQPAARRAASGRDPRVLDLDGRAPHRLTADRSDPASG